jgi:AraC-like DNA-binding protein
MLKPTLSCTGRFVRPFISVLSKYPYLEEELEAAKAQPIEPRMLVESVQDLIAHWVCATRDPDLGLRAGQLTCIGSGGALDYAFHTASTLRESLRVLQRFSKLYSEAIEIVVIKDDSRVSVQLKSELEPPRALTDFLLSTWYRNHLEPHLGSQAALECCFSYAQPASIGVHQRVFGQAKLTFGAAFDGFAFDSQVLDQTLASADVSLHDLHCEQLALVDWSAAERKSLAQRVRHMLAAEMERGRPTSVVVARRMRMSRRTLVRRLADEGTSFSVILDELRRQLALHLVMKGRLSLQEIAGSLGFVHVQAFHRSFKRWTGSTPCRYRVMTERGPAAA